MARTPLCSSLALVALATSAWLGGCAPPLASDAGPDAGAVQPKVDGGDPGDDGGAPLDDGGLIEDDGGDDLPPPPPPPSLTVTGVVIDFATREQLAGAATVSPVDILPPPTVSTTGASFTLTNVAGYSLFRLVAGAAAYRGTVSLPVQVEDEDVSAVTIEALATSFVQGAASTFGVTLEAGTGIVLARTVDENGAPVSGVPASAFALSAASPADGPYFLDGQRQADATLDETSASGYVLFFNVAAGDVTIEPSATSSYTLASTAAPLYADGATRIDVLAVAGEVTLPPNVRFDEDIVPLFEQKGCVSCHSGGGIGFDYGGLMLDASPNLTYRELTEELSPNYGVPRVNLTDPEASLVLHVPTTGPDIHPIQMFAGYTDPDYLTLLSWITDGAPRD